MARAGANVTGIDLGERALKVAQMHLLESGLEVEYRKIAVEDLADEQPGQYDIVTCMELLSMFPIHPVSSMRVHGSLAPAADAFFRPSIAIQVVPVCRTWAEYLLNLLPKGTHDYSRFIKPAELARICRKAGILPDHLTGMTYNPFTGIYALASDASVNYILGTKAA
jgi:2-polyprenyl-6-hydroxyphenyl methylase/3-demethylubiquinone-9 3-methyltransferase